MKKITQEDYAYIAGLWDADGSYTISKHFAKTKHCGKRGWVWELRMVIGMAERQGLNFVKDKFGKKRLHLSTLKSGTRFYHLTLYSNELRQVLPDIIKHAKVKKKQAKLLYNAVSIIKPKSDKKVDTKLKRMYLRMKVLNNSLTRHPAK